MCSFTGEMMNKENEYRMEECKHCGNKTKLDIVARHMDTYRGNFDCDVVFCPG